MHSNSVFAILATAAAGAHTVLAADQAKCSTKATREVVTFDDTQGLEGSVFNPVPKPYKGVAFDSFTIADVVRTGILPGVEPYSGTKYLVTGVVAEATTGEPMISVEFPESQTRSFDIHSLYYGCSANLGQAAADPGVECNIDITGYRQDPNTGEKKMVCIQRLHYEPKSFLGLGTEEMTHINIDKACSGLTSMEFDFSFAGAASALDADLGIEFDNIDMTVHECQ